MGIGNTKFEVINQHKNDMCYVQSLKKDFYLGTIGSFDRVFTILWQCHVVCIFLKFVNGLS